MGRFTALLVYCFLASFLVDEVSSSSSNSCLNRNKSGQKRYKCLPPTACKAQGNIVGHCCGKKKCCDTDPCIDTVADWIFSFDESGSMSSQDFNDQKVFYKEIVDALTISSSENRIGAMCFNQNGKMHFYLKDYFNSNDIKAEIMNLNQSGGSTNIAQALQFARDAMLAQQNGNRSNKKNIVIFATDGKNTASGNINAAAMALKAFEQTTVVTVGIGNGVDETQLKQIATSFNHYFPVSNAAELINKIPELLGQVCS